MFKLFIVYLQYEFSEAGVSNIFFFNLHIYNVNSTTIVLVKEAVK